MSANIYYSSLKLLSDVGFSTELVVERLTTAQGTKSSSSTTLTLSSSSNTSVLRSVILLITILTGFLHIAAREEQQQTRQDTKPQKLKQAGLKPNNIRETIQKLAKSVRIEF